jgi:hypothetical protein
MAEDLIIKELHKIRREHARKFEYNIQKIFIDFKQQEKKSRKKFVVLPILRKTVQKITESQ